MIRSPIFTAGTLLLVTGLLLPPCLLEAAAQVRPLQNETEQAPLAVPISLDGASVPDIRVSLNKLSFRDGEDARVTVRVSEPVYIYVFNVAQDGTVTALLPNRISLDNLVKPGQDLVFPNESLRELGVRLRVVLPKGSLRAVEEIRVVATRAKIELLNGNSLDGVFFLADKDGGRDFLQRVRKKLAALGPDDWTETSLSYEVRK